MLYFSYCSCICLYCIFLRPHGLTESVPVARLSLDELQGFMQQLQSLPCVVREAELVQVSAVGVWQGFEPGMHSNNLLECQLFDT